MITTASLNAGALTVGGQVGLGADAGVLFVAPGKLSLGIHDVRSIDATFNVCCPAGEVAVTAMMKCGGVDSRMASAELVSDRCATLSCGDNNVAPTLKLIRCLTNVAP